MKQAFREKLHLNKKNQKQLEVINEILEEYELQGYVLTLRQLYYQLVSRDVIPNQQKEYAKLSGLLVKGRMAGVVDWDAIEDRIRRPFIPYSVDDIDDAIYDTISQYRLDRQNGQEVYIELWVEKDALNPKTLHQLVKENVEELIDIDLFNDMLIKEEKDKEKLQNLKLGDDNDE